MLKRTVILMVLAAVWILGPLKIWGQSWDFGNGVVISLPTTPYAALPTVGGDIITKQVIAGVTTKMLSLWKVVDGFAGVVGEYNSPVANAQPYAALGTDILKLFPSIPASALQLHAFARYLASTSANHHIGAGVAAAYQFGPTPPTTPPPSQVVPATSRLNLLWNGANG